MLGIEKGQLGAIGRGGNMRLVIELSGIFYSYLSVLSGFVVWAKF